MDTHKNQPLDLRQKQSNVGPGQNPFKRSGRHELSQGLSSMLNAPNAISSSSVPSANLGWCWPLSAGMDFPLAAPPPDPSILPLVEQEHFRPYLQECSPLLVKLNQPRRSAKQSATAQIAAFSSRDGGISDNFYAQPGEGLLEALRAVPSTFFKEDFCLARQETWQHVVNTEDEAHRLSRLEEYSSYLDFTETQLLKEIAARSGHFFEASNIVQDLRAALHATYTQVATVRRCIRQMQTETGKQATTVTKCRRQKGNLEAVVDKLQVIEELAATEEAGKMLLKQGDYAGALDALDLLHSTLASQPIAWLHALRNLPARLQAFSQEVDDLLSQEFVHGAHFGKQADIIRSIFSGNADEPLAGVKQLTVGSAKKQESDHDSLEERLTPLVLSLHRTGHLAHTIQLFQSAAAEEVKNGIRLLVERMLQHLDPDRLQDTTRIQDKLQGLQALVFMKVLGGVEQITLASIAHVKRVAGIVDIVLKPLRGGRAQAASATLKFEAVLNSVNEAAQSRWIRLLASRSVTITSVSISELHELLGASQKFSDAMQAAGCKALPALRNACQVQSKIYLESLHHASLDSLAKAVEEEIWSAAWAVSKGQRALDSISERAGLFGREDTTTAAQQSKLIISGQNFHTVDAELLLLQLVVQYLDFIDVVPALALDGSHRVVELIKVFNSRMCQMVLGAGAMQVAGLKSITAKHLALSCQCLGLLIELHPILAQALAAQLPVSRRALLTPELGLALQDLKLHKEEIHSKLVGIMRERLIVSLKQLPMIASGWPSIAAEREVEPSSFSQSLGKQLRTLSQVLEPILMIEELKAIFGRVTALYGKNLAEAFSRLEPLGVAWEQQKLCDIQFLLGVLEELPAEQNAKDSNLQRLYKLCETHKKAIQASAAALSARDSSSKGLSSSPAHNTRSGLVARLGTAKQLFKREKSITKGEEGSASIPSQVPDSNWKEPLQQRQESIGYIADDGIDKPKTAADLGSQSTETRLQSDLDVHLTDDQVQAASMLSQGSVSEEAGNVPDIDAAMSLASISSQAGEIGFLQAHSSGRSETEKQASSSHGGVSEEGEREFGGALQHGTECSDMQQISAIRQPGSEAVVQSTQRGYELELAENALPISGASHPGSDVGRHGEEARVERVVNDGNACSEAESVGLNAGPQDATVCRSPQNAASAIEEMLESIQKDSWGEDSPG